MTSQVKLLPVSLQRDRRSKNTFNISFFPGSSHLRIAFLGTPYFLATFDGFVPDSTLVICLYFSESDNLFLFQLAIFHSIQQFKCNYNVIWNDGVFEWKSFEFEFRINVCIDRFQWFKMCSVNRGFARQFW